MLPNNDPSPEPPTQQYDDYKNITITYMTRSLGIPRYLLHPPSLYLSPGYFMNEELRQIFPEVAAWSRNNFDTQKGIEHIAPCLGLVEEMGELLECIENDKPFPDYEDAVGDIGIYSIDFMSRAGLSPEICWPHLVRDQQPKNSAMVYLSRIVHCVLKHHQGIRGFDNKEYFLDQLQIHMSDFLYRISLSYNLTDCTINTWNKVVSKRNWVANPQGK